MVGNNQITVQDWLNYIRSFREYLERRATRNEIIMFTFLGFGIYCLYISITSNDLILKVLCYIGIILSWSFSYLRHTMILRFVICISKYLNLENDLLSGKLKDTSKLGDIIPGI